MKTLEFGVSDASNVYIHTASRFAKEALYYILHIGQYFCSPGYMVARSTYISFLCIMVTKGKGYLTLSDQQYVLHEGEIALIDCTKPHTFGTNDGWEILWMHFDGAQTRRIFEEVSANIGDVILPRDFLAAKIPVERIFDALHKSEPISEILVSKYIYSALTELMLTVPEHKKQKDSDKPINMEKILSYIQENIREDITVEALARCASFSPYHFIRMFKSSTGFTPHEYIISTRINMAKRMLRLTNLSILDIAIQCGFASNSSFSMCFKRVVGTAPLLYRKNEQ